MPAASGDPLRRWRLPALFLLVAAVYANSLTTPFLFDDANAVTHNASIRQLATAFSPPVDGGTATGRPLLNATFAVNYAIGGESVVGFHLGNLLIHLAAAGLLFGLVYRTLQSPVRRPPGAADATSAPRRAANLAWLAAALWSVHPLLTESVTSIAQRTESLCGLAYLLVLYAFVRAVVSGHRGWLAVSVAAAALGMGVKEVMVTAPVIVWLYDRTFWAGSFGEAWRRRRGYYLALAATWVVLLALLVRGGGARGISAGFGLGVSPWSYLLTQADALTIYLRLAVWPYPLVFDYGTAVVAGLAEVWLQGLVVLALLGLTVWALRRRPVAGFVGAWGFVILAPSSSVVPLVAQTIAEHRMYLPLAGLATAAVIGSATWLGRRTAWLWLPVIVLFAGMTVARNADYRSALTLWRDTVRHRPQNPRAHVNLGMELKGAGEDAAARDEFARAVELDPNYNLARYNLGVMDLKLARFAEAADALGRVVAAAPEQWDARVNLGNALFALNRPAEAAAQYETVLQHQPAADVWYNLGRAYVAARRDADAARAFTAALALEPQLASAHYELGLIRQRADQPARAIEQFGAAVQLDPQLVDAHRRLGLLLAQGGYLREAEAALRAALRLDPKSAETAANLGNVLLLSGRPAAAAQAYEAALRLAPDNAGIRANLAEAQRQMATVGR